MGPVHTRSERIFVGFEPRFHWKSSPDRTRCILSNGTFVVGRIKPFLGFRIHHYVRLALGRLNIKYMYPGLPMAKQPLMHKYYDACVQPVDRGSDSRRPSLASEPSTVSREED